MRKLRDGVLVAAAILLLAAGAVALEIEDPSGDDHGPGDYVYPTDAVYTPGSFDITEVEISDKGDDVEFEIKVGAKLEDPWRMGVGFSVQMAFILIDNAPDGHTDTPPGLNVKVDESTAWDVCVLVSPHTASRVRQEIDAKGADMASSLVVPKRVKGRRSSITVRVAKSDLGGKGDLEDWRYEVLMQSNEGFPSGGDLLARKVNEFEGQHRFGGGTDYDCDPHVIDILGDHDQLASYECADDGSTVKHAVIKLVKP